jgi:hypothetical protein
MAIAAPSLGTAWPVVNTAPDKQSLALLTPKRIGSGPAVLLFLGAKVKPQVVPETVDPVVDSLRTNTHGYAMPLEPSSDLLWRPLQAQLRSNECFKLNVTEELA